MKLYPSFREAVKRGRVDLRGEFRVVLVSGYEFPSDNVEAAKVAESPLACRWEGGGEDEDGRLLPETLHAEPVEWDDDEEHWSDGCVLCQGGTPVAYERFDREKPVAVLKWPDGVLVLG